MTWLGRDEAIDLYERICENPPARSTRLLNLAGAVQPGDFARRASTWASRPTRTILGQLYGGCQASREMVVEDPDRDLLKRADDGHAGDRFELSVRARTCLKRMNIRTLGDLLRITEAELLSSRNFGESSLTEVKKMLAAKGLRLGQGLEDAHRQARRQVMESLKGSGKELMLNKPVSDLQLSVRARKALQLLNIHTLGDRKPHEAEAEALNFGDLLSEVKTRLTEFGRAADARLR